GEVGRSSSAHAQRVFGLRRRYSQAVRNAPMASNPRVLELLEEMLNSSRTPEDVCLDCPELLPEVRRRWQSFCLIDEELAALLPDAKTRREPEGGRPL